MALLPPSHLDTVVAIGLLQSVGVTSWYATGFLYWYPVNDQYGMLFLLTNKHVFEKHDAVQIRMNRPGYDNSHQATLQLKNRIGQPLWYSHEHGDIAAIRMSADELDRNGIEYRIFGHGEFVTPWFKKDLINEGDGVFVLGFPLGMSGERRNDTIVRQGIIARARDWREGRSHHIVIDANIFPGNSGGPVVIKPEAGSIQTAYLIGMVASYKPYRDVAVSQNTGNPRVIFEENSGLANIVPIDVIHETIERASAKILGAKKVEDGNHIP